MPPNASVVFSNKETIRAAPWRSADLPRKILVVRLQAFGDVAVTLPYVQALQTILPSAQFHFLTREEFGSLPCNLAVFSRVFRIAGGRDPKQQWLRAFVCLPSLRHEHYDIVIDLQRNSLSRIIRRALHPKSFCEYDRFSLLTAGERTKRTIDKLGFLPLPNFLPRPVVRNNNSGLDKLLSAHFDPSKKLILLNPAGNFSTKNWPLEFYVQFARTWIKTIDPHVQFAVIGKDHILAKAEFLSSRLGGSLISLAGSTTQAEAYNILQKADLMLTEDSGLMHLACAAQIPILALFGSTKSTWSRPTGELSVCLDSSDLECGECARTSCPFGDVHCLTRYTPDFVVRTAQELLLRQRSAGRHAV